MNIYFKYNNKSKTFSSFTKRGKIIKPDRKTQFLLPKSNCFANVLYVRDVENCSFVSINSVFEVIKPSTDDLLQTYPEECKYILVSEDGTVLYHYIQNNKLLIKIAINTPTGIVELDNISFSTGTCLYTDFLKPISEKPNEDIFTLQPEDYAHLMKKTFTGLKHEYDSAQLYRHYITTKDFRNLNPTKLLLIRR